MPPLLVGLNLLFDCSSLLRLVIQENSDDHAALYKPHVNISSNLIKYYYKLIQP